MALVRAYEGWKDAEREGSAYEYCWRNFLSAQTLQAIHSLRKQFSFILKDAGLLDEETSTNNKLSHNQSLVRAIICSGLFPGIASVVVSPMKEFPLQKFIENIFEFWCFLFPQWLQHRETSMSFKTMDDGNVLLYAVRDNFVVNEFENFEVYLINRWIYSYIEKYLQSFLLSFPFLPYLKTGIHLLQNSVNAHYQTIPYPWLVFGEKMKVNTVFLRDSTGVSDSILILFGGALNLGIEVIH